jgi:hypothetical protein
MGYSLIKELEFANYNTEANKQGWCYDFCLKFVNNHDLTKEQLEEINTNSPALESFNKVTTEMKKSKIKLEETTKAKIEAMNYGRSM